MASEPEDAPPRNRMEETLQKIREEYVEEHGQEPSEEFLEQAELEIVRRVAKADRDAHREIYDKLANE